MSTLVLGIWLGLNVHRQTTGRFDMHTHVGITSFLVAFCYLIIAAFLWRIASAYLAERDIGKAMSFIL